MKWLTTRDEALALLIGVECVGGLWRGAWVGKNTPEAPGDAGKTHEGYIAATWFPYARVGRFFDVKSAKAAVEKRVKE